MNKEIVKYPKQKRSVEKRAKILEAGYTLMSEKGYYHTNTAEIAKAAGVSSGIVYRYFKDKKDILLTALNERVEPVYLEVYRVLEEVNTKAELVHFVRSSIRQFVHFHDFNPTAFQETKSMTFNDNDFKEVVQKYRKQTCQSIEETLIRLGYDEKEAKVSAFIVYQMIDHLCDDYLLIGEKEVDYDLVIEKNVQLIEILLRIEIQDE